jgi:hypothetical protein
VPRASVVSGGKRLSGSVWLPSRNDIPPISIVVSQRENLFSDRCQGSMTPLIRLMGEPPSSSQDDSATLGAAWSRLRSRTHSRVLPHLLITFFYVWPLFLESPPRTGESTSSAIVVVPMIAADFWFYGIVLVRLAAVAPVGRTFNQSAGNLWLLFMGYSIWLGFFPPTERKSWSEWGAWILVIVGLVATLVAT